MANYKYKQMYDWIKQQIESGGFAAGAKIPTETELMEQFSVSRDTVRSAIALLEQEGYLKKKQGAGTFVIGPSDEPASPLTNGGVGSRKIGIIMRQTDNYIFPNIINAIHSRLAESDYTAVVTSTAGNLWLERLALTQALQEDYDGLIIEPTKSSLPSPNIDLYREIYRAKPTVLLHAKLAELPFPAVTSDYCQGEYLLTKYLLEQGHREIAFFCKIDEYPGTERYRGYLKAFSEFSLPYPQENIVFFTSEDFPMIFSADLAPRVKQVLEHSSVVICHTDQFAYPLYTCLKYHNIDIPIAGYDNARIAENVCALTVSHPKEEIGTAAAESILRLIQQPNADVSFEFGAELIVRQPCPFTRG